MASIAGPHVPMTETGRCRASPVLWGPLLCSPRAPSTLADRLLFSLYSPVGRRDDRSCQPRVVCISTSTARATAVKTNPDSTSSDEARCSLLNAEARARSRTSGRCLRKWPPRSTCVLATEIAGDRQCVRRGCCCQRKVNDLAAPQCHSCSAVRSVRCSPYRPRRCAVNRGNRVSTQERSSYVR